MHEFQYVVQTSGGVIQKGHIASPSQAMARSQLSDRGLKVVSIRPRGRRTTVHHTLATQSRNFSVRSRELELTLQQLAVMLDSGLELAESLRELARYSPRSRQRHLCTQLGHAVERGEPLSAALGKVGCRHALVIQLTHVGEETGQLGDTLRRAAEFLENRREAFSNLISALAYPLLVGFAAGGVAIYLVGWAIPKLAKFLEAMGRKLPGMTQSLLDVAAFVQVYGWALLVVAVSLAVGSFLFYKWPPGRTKVDRWVLSTPVVGPIIRMSETHQFASALALMLRSGVFLPDALTVAATLHRNQYLSNLVGLANTRLGRGKDLASSFADFGFAELLPSMIAIGERSGNLPQALDHVAKFYFARVRTRMQRLSRLVEPLMIVSVGGVVGYVYMAFFLALMSAGGKF